VGFGNFKPKLSCLLSIFAIAVLQVAVEYFEKSADQQPLTFSDKMEFINLWYIMIVVNDVLSIGGSIAKLLIETKVRFLVTEFFSIQWFAFAFLLYHTIDHVQLSLDELNIRQATREGNVIMSLSILIEAMTIGSCMVGCPTSGGAVL
jgi:hypothetical protein